MNNQEPNNYIIQTCYRNSEGRLMFTTRKISSCSPSKAMDRVIMDLKSIPNLAANDILISAPKLEKNVYKIQISYIDNNNDLIFISKYVEAINTNEALSIAKADVLLMVPYKKIEDFLFDKPRLNHIKFTDLEKKCIVKNLSIKETYENDYPNNHLIKDLVGLIT
jgi:hypothetical protein